MTPIEIAVISVVIIFGFAAWLIARKRGADEWQRKYAEKLTRQHEDAMTPLERAATPQRITWARNRVEYWKLEVAKELRLKRGRIGVARLALSDCMALLLRLEGASK